MASHDERYMDKRNVGEKAMKQGTAEYVEGIYTKFCSLPKGSIERTQYGVDKVRGISALYRKTSRSLVKQRMGDILANIFSELTDTTGYTLKDGVFIKDEQDAQASPSP